MNTFSDNDIFGILFDLYGEDDFPIEKDWYYHAFAFDEERFTDILTDGIKSPKLLKKETLGNNGKYYISLSKNLNIGEESTISAYNIFSYLPMFIIDGKIRTYKASNEIIYPTFITNSILPLRDSEYLDEYQAFLKVKSDKILGIAYNLYQNYDTYGDRYSIDNLKTLKRMILLLDEMDKKLPIIDPKMKLEIDKRKVLELNI